MIPIQLFCSYLTIIRWLQNHLVTCPFKKLTSLDCPGCGFQRASLELFQGNLTKSLVLYPATIPIIICIVWGITNPKRYHQKIYKTRNFLFFFTAAIIALSYLLKMGGITGTL